MPPHRRQGHRWTDDRLEIDGGVPPDADGHTVARSPARLGPWQTVYNRHRRWSAEGTWERILDALLTGSDVPDGRSGGQVWTAAVDSTFVRAHQHAARSSAPTAAAEDLGAVAGQCAGKDGWQAVGPWHRLR
ncbi:transposase [Actinoplanes sp. CA-030573]|uniref:transposase n=1 Tax=Actinoplanes sp. CA-030573 TaxID=3239898 RepID=UPI003D8B0D68